MVDARGTCDASSVLSVSGVWNLHAQEGRNIQLHFLDFALEIGYDVMEVRDGAGPESVLLGEELCVCVCVCVCVCLYMCVVGQCWSAGQRDLAEGLLMSLRVTEKSWKRFGNGWEP